jgi:hypothetical protein
MGKKIGICWMSIKLLKCKIVIQEDNLQAIEVLVALATIQSKITTRQILMMDYVNQQKVKVINKNPKNVVIKAEIRKQNQQYLYQELKIINNFNSEHKKCKKV